MATYLTGSQDLARECGLTQTPSDVTTQVGLLNRIINWYKDAYIEIQGYTDWRWLRHEFTVTTSSDDDSYVYTDAVDSTTASAISRFERWIVDDPEDPPRIYLQSAGSGTESYLTFIPWIYFKQLYQFGSQTSQYPQHISVDPQNNLRLGPAPNGVYVVTSEYYRSVQTLSADGDTPEMPSQYHDLIWKWALGKYGLFKSAQHIVARYNVETPPRLYQLLHDQGESVSMAEALC